MPIKNLPINVGLDKNVDEVGLRTNNAAMQDVYVDDRGGVNRRPGMTELCDLGTSAKVDGLFWWEKYGIALAVSNGKLFKITANDGTFSEISFNSGAFSIGSRVYFANFDTAVYAANGNAVYKIISTGNAAPLADVDAPTGVSSVVCIDRYLIMLEVGTRKAWFSAVNAPDTHEGDYFSKDAQFDKLQTIAVADLEIYLMGSSTLEVWYNDGTTPFSRLGQGFSQSGTVAADSLAYCDTVSSFLWLDHRRNVVILQGRTPKSLSESLNAYIQGFTTVSDANGHYLLINGRPYYILSFDSEDKTLVWDFIRKQWYEWGYWDTLSSTYTRFRGNCYCMSPAWNMVLSGDKSNGKIYRIDPTYFSDDGDDIRMLDRTGHVDWGMPTRWKKCKSLSLRLKRTQVSVGVGDVDLIVQYRDNGSSSWSTERVITMSSQTADTEFDATLTQLGRYKTRQWQFIFTDPNIGCSLVQAQEDFELL
jgi:hypothetical protein